MNKLAQYLNQHLAGEVVVDPQVVASVATDNSPLTLTPDMVAFPRSTSDIRKLLRFTWQLAEKGHSLPVTARGAGTNTIGAAIGTGIVVSLSSHMNRVLEYDIKQRLVRLQPGVSVTTLKNTLDLQDVCVPDIAIASPEATIGGLIANGPTMDPDSVSIKELEVVLANGDVLQTKRLSKRELNKKKGQQGMEADIYRGIDAIIDENQKLVEQLAPQSASGYASLADVKRKDGSLDLTPLIIGSQGTLGIISEMILKTETLSEATATVIAAFDDASKARDAIDAVEKVNPAAVEYYDGAIISQAQASGKEYTFLKDIQDNVAAMLVVSLTDFSSRTQAKKRKKLSRVFAQYDAIVSFSEDIDSSEYANLSTIRRLATHSDAKDEAAIPLVEGAYVPIEQFESFAEGLQQLAHKRRVDLPLYGRPLDGIWYTRPILNLNTIGGKQTVFKLIEEYGELVGRCGGYLAGESGEGRLQSFVTHKTFDEEITKLFTDVKQLFDPHNILNPGVKQPNDVRDLASQLRSSYDAARL